MRHLPLLANHSPGRAAVTCRYRCGDACFHDVPNTSGNPYFGDLLDRRSAIKAGVVLGAALTATGATAAADAAPAHAAPPAEGTGADRHHPARGLDFRPVEPNTLDAVVVPEGYRQAVVIRWGDPLFPDAPAFDFDHQTAAAQARQFGYNCDFAALLPLDPTGRVNLLVTNHEYTGEPFMFRGYDEANPTREQVEVAWAAHGLSVLRVDQDRDGRLTPRFSPHNRRITATTPFELRGPAAGSDLLKTGADPTGTRVLGTLNNCAGGVTPWGTVLSGEENFNQYFAATGDPRETRYGIKDNPTTRKWERFDERFDLAREPNEANRFGWVVELDPLDPDSTPVKHTALGRFKHECANVRIAGDGRVVAYSGDDERFEYIYKFISRKKVRRGDSRSARRHNMTLLDEGTLYVARFTGDSPPAEIDGSGGLPSDGRFDGRGEWVPLASGTRSFVPGMTAEEVYVFTRLAGDRVGATKMDRPEDIQTHPHTGVVYCALSNNVDRGKEGKEGATEPNPRVDNKHGQVLELTERGGDALALSFSWNLMLVCGDPASPDTYFAGYDKSRVSPISSPDNVAFDRHGNLWISSDSGGALGGLNDGLYAVPVAGRERGHLKAFLTVPRGAETCGPVIGERVVTVCVQHPGEVDGASADNPASHWPDGGDSQPRPSVVAVWREGRRIGE
ncbi:PhoX family phosphatase [Saccharothrix longispora]|uniref:Secreted PhoX family phosphatase n=1 Tax=Saccharothrix longispora TaxID=33920 RepID=A0ABU1Q355_9PSEU|nr:PhoX family phosphatase [Saccharothrix longispora]MDR6597320.1 secreted PhoX family phosphatase [Saccharothrix longispora]